MPVDQNNNFDLQSIINTLILVGTFIGAGVAWWFLKGLPAWRKDRAAHQDLRERERASQKSIDFKTQLMEDKNLHVALKALLLMQNERIDELEDRDVRRTKELQQLHTAYVTCVEHHAAESEKVKQLESYLAEQRKQNENIGRQYDNLSRRFNRLRSTLKLEPDENGIHVELKPPIEDGQ